MTIVVDTPENKDNRPFLVTLTREEAGIGFALWVDQFIVLDPRGTTELDLELGETANDGEKNIYALVPPTWKVTLENASEVEAGIQAMKERVAKATAERREKIYEQIQTQIRKKAPWALFTPPEFQFIPHFFGHPLEYNLSNPVGLYFTAFVDAWNLTQGPNGLDRILRMRSRQLPPDSLNIEWESPQ